MATGVDLYEALKPTVGEEAAKMIAEALPMGDRVATKTDIDRAMAATKTDIDRAIAATKADIDRVMAATKADIDRAIAATKSDIDRVMADIERVIATMASKEDLARLEARTFRWMLGFFATLWLGNAGVIITLLTRP